MTEQQMKLVQKAGGLYADPDPAKHGALRQEVLKVALTPEATLAEADRLAGAVNSADNDMAKAEAEYERAKFRAWMRVQATAEQGGMFESAPKMTIQKEGE